MDSPNPPRSVLPPRRALAWLRVQVATVRTAGSSSLGSHPESWPGSPGARRWLPAQRALTAPGLCETRHAARGARRRSTCAAPSGSEAPSVHVEQAAAEH